MTLLERLLRVIELGASTVALESAAPLRGTREQSSNRELTAEALLIRPLLSMLKSRGSVGRLIPASLVAGSIREMGYVFVATDLAAHKGAAETVPFPMFIALMGCVQVVLARVAATRLSGSKETRTGRGPRRALRFAPESAGPALRWRALG